MNKYTVDLYLKWEEILNEEFISEWKKLYSNSICQNIFNNPDLQLAWIYTYKEIRNLKPLFLKLKINDSVVLFTLVLWKKNIKNLFLKTIIPVGYSDFDYHNFIQVGESNLNWEEIFDLIKEQIIKIVKFDIIEIDGLTYNIISKNYKEIDEICPYYKFDYNTSLDVLETFPTKLRGDIKRQIKRLNNEGLLNFEVISEKSEIKKLLPLFLKLHSEKWPNAYKAKNFHENLIKYSNCNFDLNFSILKIDDKIISYHLGFKDKMKFYYYMPIINPNWSKFSPGKVHLYYLYLYSVNEKLRIFDHLRGNENYKTGWSKSFSKIYEYKFLSDNMMFSLKRNILKFKKYFE